MSPIANDSNNVSAYPFQGADDYYDSSNNYYNNCQNCSGPNDTSGGGVPFDELTIRRWQLANTTEAVAVPIVFAFIFVVGLVGNGTLIVSVLANKVMRNVPNILIVSLSMGDFLLILISIPLTSTIYTFYGWPYGVVVCKINEFLHTTSLGISIFSLMALSADRYVAIVDPMAKLTGRTTRLTILLAAGIWLISILCAIPDAVFTNVIRYPISTTEGIEVCIQYPAEYGELYVQVYTVIKFIVFFILPIHTIAIFYVLMSHILIQSSKGVPMEMKNGAASNCRQIAARKRVAYVVFSFVILFTICWLPRHLYLMINTFAHFEYNNIWHVFKITSFCLKFINSCINPIACYFLSGQFRKYFNRYLFCCCNRRRYAVLETRGHLHALNSTTRRGSPTSSSVMHTQSAF